MGEMYDLRRLRNRKLLPIPQSACRIIGALFGRELNQANAIGRTTFSLRRRRDGVEIMFHMPTGPNTSFSWNATAALGRHHTSFAEARKWVAAYAAGHGQTIAERRKERMKQPTGEDRKIWKAGGCKEAWLSSDSPILAAEAMLRCKHSGAFCWQDGWCHMGTCDMIMKPAPTYDAQPPGLTVLAPKRPVE